MSIQAEYNELLEDLVRECSYDEFDPCKDVTAQMLADRLGVSWRVGRDILEDNVRIGALIGHKVRLPNGKISMAYKKKE